MNCYLCDRDLPRQANWRSIFLTELEAVICNRCRGSFEQTEAGCHFCGFPGAEICSDCSHWEKTPYAGVIDSGKSLFRYNSAMKDYLHQYKFLKDVVLAEVFAPVLREELRSQKAVIVPIPMNENKLKERTFPQVDRLLDAASLPYVHLLGKNEVGLGGKSKAERLAMQDVFWWNKKPVPEKVLLFDDLYTTGSTMRLAAKALKAEGVKEITILTLIRA